MTHHLHPCNIYLLPKHSNQDKTEFPTAKKIKKKMCNKKICVKNKKTTKLDD